MRRLVMIGIACLLGACVGDMGPHRRAPTGDPGGSDAAVEDGGMGDASVGDTSTEDGAAEDGAVEDGDTPGDEPPVRPTDSEDAEVPDEPAPPPLVPAGGRCDCDSDCEPTAGQAPLCIHGICGVRATDDECPGGSTGPCPAGHRCWSGTGRGVCYPDYVEGACAGQADSDGSCVSDGELDCYRVCGDLCGLDGDPPGGGPDDPCDGLDYLGECDGSMARWCSDGRLQEIDCAGRGQVCDYVNDRIGWFCTDGSGPGPTPPDPGDGCGDAVVIEQIRLTNEARGAAGLGALTCDEGLTRAAYLHCNDMCEQGYFSHTSRDGRSFTDRIREQGVSFGTAGENIAWGQATASEVHTTWMNSWGHRANILGSGYRRIGVGYEPCGGRPLWTQDFTD
jgi:hypothetical protein